MHDEVVPDRVAARPKPNRNRNRRRCRSGGDDDSSSDDGRDGTNPTRRRGSAATAPLPPVGHDETSAREEAEEDSQPQQWSYRDRARERREGQQQRADNNNNKDDDEDESTSAIFDKVVEAWEVGDVRSKIFAPRNEESPVMMEDDNYQQQPGAPASTLAEALNRLERFRPTSSLGKELLPFLRQQYDSSSSVTSTAAAATAMVWQPSILTFSCNSAAVHRAWERPLERTFANSLPMDDDTGSALFLKGTPCTPSLLAAMEKSLARAQLLQQEMHKPRSSALVKDETWNRSKDAPLADDDDDDDDEDIFGGVGDYDGATACLVVPPHDGNPPAATAAATMNITNSNGMEQGPSTVENDSTRQLEGKETTTATTTTVAGLFTTETRPASVSHAGTATTTTATSSSSRLVGLASSHHHSLYGMEGIGMDFDARDYDDDEDAKPKKKKRRKKGHDSDDDD